MKNIIFIIFLAVASSAFAQQEDSNSAIAVSVAFTNQAESLSLSLQEKLRNKVAQILSRGGVAAEGWAQDFVVYPKINIYDEQTIGGTQNKVFVKAELSLYMKQTDNDLLFSSVAQTITGSGTNKETALSQAIGSIRPDSKDLQSFVAEGKKRILDHYAKNCNQFLNKARTYAQLGEYGEAFVQLFQVPVQAEDCYAKAQKEMQVVYLAWQKNNCQRGIQNAKAAIAVQDWNLALEYLTTIDPASSCFAEAGQLVSKIEGKVNEEAMRNWNFLMTVYKDSVELEKYRMNTAVEIARACASRKPNNIYYNLIVK